MLTFGRNAVSNPSLLPLEDTDNQDRRTFRQLRRAVAVVDRPSSQTKPSHNLADLVDLTLDVLLHVAPPGTPGILVV